ncbi:MAG TPA: redoxin domain-containing protein [Candidatus Sulfotelmatobacter sp.]|jgi:peroxiredoxin|nr:redoxin domain-containing protein [Candidatus Sulfotelmatobacter sp.]
MNLTRLLQFAGMVAAMFCLSLATCAAGPQLTADGLTQTLEIGAAAPEFDLPGVDGKRHSLKDYADARILMIVFTANHCKTAQAYEERLKQIVNDYSDKGVRVVAIGANDPQALSLSEMVYSDMGDSLAEMKIRAQERNFNYPYLYDGDTQATARAYGPVSTPHVFIFDQARKLRYVGRVDNSENIDNVTQQDARAALDALLAGKPVPVEKTRTFGCSIKWSEKRAAAARELAQMEQEPVTLEPADTNTIQALVKNDGPKLRLINVWATWCGPCLRELPDLVTMNRMYRNGDFEVITISGDDPDKKDKVLAALQERKVACRNYLFSSTDKDALGTALDPEWPGGFPYTILVAPGGKIIQRQMGEMDAMKLKKAIAYFPGR